MRASLLQTVGALSSLLCLEARADAVALPPLALGNTSFLDGIARPGLLFELPLQHYRSDGASDAGGHSVPGRQRVRSTTVLPHLAYLSENTLLGATMARKSCCRWYAWTWTSTAARTAGAPARAT